MAKPYDDEDASILKKARDRVQQGKRGLSINMEIQTVVGRKQ